MTRLILVKHSQPAIVEKEPARAWQLSEDGRARVKPLATQLRPYRPDVICSSLEPKALETASLLAELLGLEVQGVDGLHEHERQHEPYHPRLEFERRVAALFAQPERRVFGEESGADALQRFGAAVEGLVRRYARETLLVVSHGTVIALYVSWLTGDNGLALWRSLGLPSFVVLDREAQTLLSTVNIA